MSTLPVLEGFTPAISSDRAGVFIGDAVELLAALPECCIDSVITDPPYALDFNSQSWDSAKGFRESLNIDTQGMNDGADSHATP